MSSGELDASESKLCGRWLLSVLWAARNAVSLNYFGLQTCKLGLLNIISKCN